MNEITDGAIHQNIKRNSPLIAWIHNISLNQQKYMKSKMSEFDLGHDIRYVIFIYDNPGCSQKDLVSMFGLSKGNIAKILKKLEDEGFIKREPNPENRRQYMLNATEKGKMVVPKFRKISRQWEREVGITDRDEEFKKRLVEIAVSCMKLIE